MKFEGRQRFEARLNLVPLINIIFLLLIFFMFAGSIKSPDPFGVELPTSDNGNPSVEPLYEEFVLHISPDNELALNGQALAWSDLPARAGGLLQGRQDAAVRIDIDAGAPTGGLADAMRILKAAGAKSVLLSTQAGQER